MGRIEITNEQIDINKIIKEMVFTNENIGALVCFLGIIRKFNENRKVTKLFYDVYYELAIKQLERIKREAIDKFKIKDATIIHRVGEVPIGEISFVVITIGEHREETFKAAKWIVDTVKANVAIWKKEIFEEGAIWL